jgi:hypothetical protein
MDYRMLIPATAAFIVGTLILATASAREKKPAAPRKAPPPVPPGVVLEARITYRVPTSPKKTPPGRGCTSPPKSFTLHRFRTI